MQSLIVSFAFCLCSFLLPFTSLALVWRFQWLPAFISRRHRNRHCCCPLRRHMCGCVCECVLLLCVWVCVCLCLPSWQIFLIFIAFAHKWNCLKSICRFYYYSCNSDSAASRSHSLSPFLFALLCLWHANSFPFSSFSCSACSCSGLEAFCSFVSWFRLYFLLGFFLRIPFGFITCQRGGVGAAFLFKFIQFICPKNMQTFCPHIRIFLRTVSVHFWLFFCPCSLPLSRSLFPFMLSIHFWHILCALSVVCPCHLWVQLRHNLCSTTFLWLWPVLP